MTRWSSLVGLVDKRLRWRMAFFHVAGEIPNDDGGVFDAVRVDAEGSRFIIRPWKLFGSSVKIWRDVSGDSSSCCSSWPKLWNCNG